jgi:hypothetical protein
MGTHRLFQISSPPHYLKPFPPQFGILCEVWDCQELTLGRAPLATPTDGGRADPVQKPSI